MTYTPTHWFIFFIFFLAPIQTALLFGRWLERKGRAKQLPSKPWLWIGFFKVVGPSLVAILLAPVLYYLEAPTYILHPGLFLFIYTFAYPLGCYWALVSFRKM